MTGFLRLKQISSLLQLNAGDTQKLFTYKHRKKLYSHFDSVWYEFKNMKDVIVSIKTIFLLLYLNFDLMESHSINI